MLFDDSSYIGACDKIDLSIHVVRTPRFDVSNLLEQLCNILDVHFSVK